MLAAENVPALETADYDHHSLQVIPADPQYGQSWLSESNVPEVEKWLASFGNRDIFVVFSRSMAAYATYFGAPHGYAQLANAAQSTIGWSVVYRNADTTIYRVSV